MKVNRRSWHFKLIDTLFEARPNNLCRYFWTVVASVAVSISLGLAALISLLALLYPILQIWMGTDTGLAITSSALWIVVGIGVFNIYRDELRRSRAFPDIGEFDTTKFYHQDLINRVEVRSEVANVAVEYVRAKKQKICPLIDYTDE